MVPHLAPGAATVGTGVDVRHLAATPPGMRVRATAILMQTDGHRCLFEVEAWDEVEKIAEGWQQRSLVSDRAGFLVRAASKGRASLTPTSPASSTVSPVSPQVSRSAPASTVSPQST